MTTSGSGNQGMTCSLPIIQYCHDKLLNRGLSHPGLFFSHLATIHIKSNVGRLSAYCGAICASAGVSGRADLPSGGAPWSSGRRHHQHPWGNLSGVICDGAKASCALKIASASTPPSTAPCWPCSSGSSTQGRHRGGGHRAHHRPCGRAGSGRHAETDSAILEIMLSKL